MSVCSLRRNHFLAQVWVLNCHIRSFLSRLGKILLNSIPVRTHTTRKLISLHNHSWNVIVDVTAHSLTFHVVAGNKQNWLDLPLLIDGIFFILSRKTIYFWLSLSKFIISFSCFSFYVINLLMFFYIIASFLHTLRIYRHFII